MLSMYYDRTSITTTVYAINVSVCIRTVDTRTECLFAHRFHAHEVLKFLRASFILDTANFLRAFFSICLMRSLVSLNFLPMSSSVTVSLLSIPKRILRTSSSLADRRDSELRTQ